MRSQRLRASPRLPPKGDDGILVKEAARQKKWQGQPASQAPVQSKRVSSIEMEGCIVSSCKNNQVTACRGCVSRFSFDSCSSYGYSQGAKTKNAEAAPLLTTVHRVNTLDTCSIPKCKSGHDDKVDARYSDLLCQRHSQVLEMSGILKGAAAAVARTMQTKRAHPYLDGNFAPVKRELPMTECAVVQGRVPDELSGGQYVRNGGNPLKDEDEQRDAHWFDGDGMLTGVLFQRRTDDPDAPPRPHFINRYILTDVLLSTGSGLETPIIPSITTFAATFTPWNVALLMLRIMRAVILCLLSWLPWQARFSVRRISVANTSVWWHDGRAFAGCESGPPVRILLPGLETAEWWTGEEDGNLTKAGSLQAEKSTKWSKSLGPLTMLSEFTTAHPRVDPVTNELLLYHMSFMAPFLRVSVIPPRSGPASTLPAIKGLSVPGVDRPKLAHDFCATSKNTIMIDMPLVLDPRNLVRGRPMLSYEASLGTRFGIFPRRHPEDVQWFESESCCIYHAANAWDEDTLEMSTTNLVACRLNSATLVYAAGNMPTPADAIPKEGQEKCQMYYWQFPRRLEGESSDKVRLSPTCEFALSDIPVEFPTVNHQYTQRENQFVYAASMTHGGYDAGLGARSAKIDCLVKFDIRRLIGEGHHRIAKGTLVPGQAVDERTVPEILAEQSAGQHGDSGSAIRLFPLPAHCYAQEATFVPRATPRSEDDGFLIFFVFDESKGLDARTGRCHHDARSELWVIDAHTMTDIVCRISLPQRVPYGLHGHFFDEQEIQSQRPVDETLVRNWALARSGVAPRSGGIGLGGAKPGLASYSVSPSQYPAVYGNQLMSSLRASIERLLS